MTHNWVKARKILDIIERNDTNKNRFLIESLKDSCMLAKRLAILALGKFKAGEAAGPLMRLMFSFDLNHEYLNLDVARTLTAIGPVQGKCILDFHDPRDLNLYRWHDLIGRLAYAQNPQKACACVDSFLASPYPNVRQLGLQLLQTVPCEAAAPLIMQKLQSISPSDRNAALLALQPNHYREALPALLRIIDNPQSPREEIAPALRIMERLNDTSSACLKSLGNWLNFKGRYDWWETGNKCIALLARTGAPGRRELAFLLSHGTTTERMRIMESLSGDSGIDSSFLSPIRELARSRDAFIKHAAMRALLRIDFPFIIDTVVQSADSIKEYARIIGANPLLREKWRHYVRNRLGRHLQSASFERDTALLGFLRFLFIRRNHADGYYCRELSNGFEGRLAAYLHQCLRRDPARSRLYLSVLSSLCDPSLAGMMTQTARKEKNTDLLREIISDARTTAEPSTYPFMLSMLDHPKPVARFLAVQFFLKYKSPSAVPKLVRMLGEKDQVVVDPAPYPDPYFSHRNFNDIKSLKCLIMETLGEIGDKSALPAILKAMSRGNGALILSGIHAVAKLKDTASVPALIRYLKNPDREIRFEALYAVDSLPNSRCIPPLTELLNSNDPQLRSAALGRMGRMGLPAAGIIERFIDAPGLGDDPALYLLALGDPKYLRPALRRLGRCIRCGEENGADYWENIARRLYPKFDSQAGIDSLMSIMSEPGLRDKAMDLLSGMENPIIVRRVRPLLKGLDPELTFLGLRIAERFKDTASIGDILPLLEGPPDTRCRAFDVLCSMYTKSLFKPLYRFAASFYESQRRLDSMALIVGQSPNVRTGHPLNDQRGIRVNRMLQTDWSVHRTPPDTQFHCALLRGILSGIEIPFDFIRVDYLSDPELLKEIACRLEGEHLLPVIRRLGALKDTGAGPLLRFFIKNSSPRIRNEAIAACRSIGDRTWTAAILDFIKEFNRGGSEIDFEQMRSITTALTERTDTAAVLPLIEMLSTAPREYRRLAADALAKIGDRRAIIPLQRCLYVPDGLVVESAICALGSFYDSSSVRLLVDRIDADSSENALVRMGAPALDALFRAFDAGLHSEGADAATMAALGAAKPDEFARRIAAAMKSDYHRERMSAALALGMNRNGNFSAMLKTATNDSISMVRTAALWALWATRDSSMHSGSLGVRPEAELNVFPLTLPQIRAHERRAVGAIASDTTFAIARSFANDCNPGIRYIARFTLKQSGRSIEN